MNTQRTGTATAIPFYAGGDREKGKRRDCFYKQTADRDGNSQPFLH